MPIVGFNFDKISVEKMEQPTEKVEVKHNIKLKDAKQEKLPVAKQEEAIKFSFMYNVEYLPKVGNILIEGHLFYLDEPKKIKEILAKWKKEQKIEQTLMQQIMNNIVVKCNIKSLSLSQDVNLPPHIPLPLLRPRGQRPEDYIG